MPERVQAKKDQMNDDPQIHSDTPLRTKRSLSELGRGYFTATEWEGHGVPWLARSVVAATLLLVLLCVGIAELWSK
jgi:hypothetical protein